MKKQRQVAKGVQQGMLQPGRGFTRELGRSVKSPSFPTSTDPHGRMIEQRRQEGLYFRCGEKYYRGHQCRMKQLLLLGGEKEDGQEKEDNLQPLGELDEDNEEISLHAMKGWTNNKIIKMEGKMEEAN